MVKSCDRSQWTIGLGHGACTRLSAQLALMLSELLIMLIMVATINNKLTGLPISFSSLLGVKHPSFRFVPAVFSLQEQANEIEGCGYCVASAMMYCNGVPAAMSLSSPTDVYDMIH